MIAVHMCAGDLARLENRRDDAKASYRQGAEIAEVTNHPQLRAGLMIRLSAIAIEARDIEGSMAILADALDNARAIGDQRVAINVLIEMGRRHRTANDWSAARARFVEALRLARDLSVSPLICAALCEWSECERAAGDLSKARRLAGVMLHFDCGSLGPSIKLLIDEVGALRSDLDGDVDDALVELLNEDMFGLVRL